MSLMIIQAKAGYVPLHEREEVLYLLDRAKLMFGRLCDVGFCKEAIQLLNSMQAAKMSVDVDMYNRAMCSCAYSGQFDRTLKLLDCLPLLFDSENGKDRALIRPL